MTTDAIRLFDADSHVAEPAGLWDGEYMDPNFRGASPFRFIDTVTPDGRHETNLYQGGTLLMENAGYTAAAGLPEDKLVAGFWYSESNPGGWDPRRRVADMDVAGIERQVVNPSSPGLRVGFVEEPRLGAAMCRAYNDWVADHCAETSGRVNVNMIIPWQDPELAEEELVRQAGKDAFRGVVMRPAPEYPTPGGFVGDDLYDTVYSLIEETGLILVFHSCAPEEGLVGPLTRHYKRTRPYWHATLNYGILFGFPIENWTAFAQLVFEGVLDRHPRLKVMLTESHGGWFITALERMDEYAKGGEALRHAFSIRLDHLPSEYFERQGFVVFEGDEKLLDVAAEHIGNSIVWAIDYPHADSSFPHGGRDFLDNLAKLPEEKQRAIAWDNAARAFSLTS